MASPIPHPCLCPDVFVLAVLFQANEKPRIHSAPPSLLAFVKEVQKTSLQVGGTGTGAGNGEEGQAEAAEQGWQEISVLAWAGVGTVTLQVQGCFRYHAEAAV